MLRRAGSQLGAAGQAKKTSIKILWLQGFLTSAVNPKAVVFFAALFPQFINPNQPVAMQFIILSITYIAVDGVFLASYGASASWIAKRMKNNGKALLDRVGGTFLIGAALLLGAKTIRE